MRPFTTRYPPFESRGLWLQGIGYRSVKTSSIGSGRSVWYCQSLRRMYGYEADEVIGRANSSILHTPEDIAAGKPREMMETARREGKWEGVIDRVRKDGRRITASTEILDHIRSNRRRLSRKSLDSSAAVPSRIDPNVRCRASSVVKSS